MTSKLGEWDEPQEPRHLKVDFSFFVLSPVFLFFLFFKKCPIWYQEQRSNGLKLHKELSVHRKRGGDPTLPVRANSVTVPAEKQE